MKKVLIGASAIGAISIVTLLSGNYVVNTSSDQPQDFGQEAAVINTIITDEAAETVLNDEVVDKRESQSKKVVATPMKKAKKQVLKKKFSEKAKKVTFRDEISEDEMNSVLYNKSKAEENHVRENSIKYDKIIQPRNEEKNKKHSKWVNHLSGVDAKIDVAVAADEDL